MQSYIKILLEDIDYKAIKIELFYGKQSEALRRQTTFDFIRNLKSLPQSQMTESLKFDQTFKKLLSICSKHYKEVDRQFEHRIWYIVVDALFAIRKKEVVAKKTYFKEFIKQRMVVFLQALVENLEFKECLDYIAKNQEGILYSELKDLVREIFNNYKSEESVILNANAAIYKVNT